MNYKQNYLTIKNFLEKWEEEVNYDNYEMNKNKKMREGWVVAQFCNHYKPMENALISLKTEEPVDINLECEGNIYEIQVTELKDPIPRGQNPPAISSNRNATKLLADAINIKTGKRYVNSEKLILLIYINLGISFNNEEEERIDYNYLCKIGNQFRGIYLFHNNRKVKIVKYIQTYTT
jgi:hypothetical protein